MAPAAAGRFKRTIRSVVNPDKLAHLGPVDSLRDVLEGGQDRT